MLLASQGPDRTVLPTNQKETIMDRERILAELKKGAHAWNNWRKINNRCAINLDGLELIYFNFDDYDLSKVSMRGSRISYSSFKHADLISADLSDASLTHNDFSHAKLIATQFKNSDLSNSLLFNANLLTAGVTGATLDNIDFSGLDISGLALKNISLEGSNLSHQKLARIDFSSSNLTNANFTATDLTGAVFTGAKLAGAVFKQAQLNNANFKGADVTGVDFRGLDLIRTNFTAATMVKCDLREAKLCKAKLLNSDITGAKLWKIVTSCWNIANINCEHAFWDKAGKEKTNYRPHEFERIFGESITIELRYPYRLADHELATLPIFIEHLSAVHWGIILRLKSISDIAGGALVQFVVEETAGYSPTQLKADLQDEADRIQLAQLVLRTNTQLHAQLKEKIGAIREEFWPRLLELAADHEREQVRNLTILFMDLKGFSKWADDELSEKLSLFRGLVKPILKKWGAGHPNMEGDSLRATFTNATAGLSCACMIRNVLTAAGFELRIGLELGEVAVVHNEVTDIPDLEGVAVSMAARLEGAASSGEVLVSHKIRHYTERSNLFRFTPRRVPLKKSIGTLQQGEHIECFAVTSESSLQEVLA